MRIEVLPNGECAVVYEREKLTDNEKEFLKETDEFNGGSEIRLDCDEIKVFLPGGKVADVGKTVYYQWAKQYGIEMSSEFKKLSYEVYLRKQEAKAKTLQREEERKVQEQEIAKRKEERERLKKLEIWEKRKAQGCIFCDCFCSVADDLICKHSKDLLDFTFLDPKYGLGLFAPNGVPTKNCKYCVEGN